MNTIAVVNQSTVVTDTQVAACVVALQQQVYKDFNQSWGIFAFVTLHKPTDNLTGMWQLVILDNSDQADALGYHELTADGHPLGKVFAKSDLDAGTSWTVTASHELLEMLVDPWINLAAESDGSDGSITMYAYEVGDPVEADNLGYSIGGILLSDFVLPSWFQPLTPGPWSFRHNVAAAFTLAPGGYISILQVGSGAGWTQVTADKVTSSRGLRANIAPPGSRRARRRIPDKQWRRSRH